MTAVAAAAFAGVPVGMPAPPRNAAFVPLGISMGSGLTPESLARMRTWPASLLLLAASVAATALAGALHLERAHRWDRATARFAAMPGAFSAVVVLAAAGAADLPRVVLASMPPVLRLSSAAPQGGGGAAAAPVTSAAPEALATLAAGAAAVAPLARLRVPAGVLLGAMLASAALHGSGLVHGRLPPPLVVLGFVAAGAVIGARFRGTSPAVLRATLPGALGAVLVALALSAGFTAAGARLLGLPFAQLRLAYAPGGVEAMAAMALALQLDPAFVGAHHVLRILGLNLAAPLWLRGRAIPPRRSS